MKFSEYLLESQSFPKVWYHGTKVDFQKFDPKYAVLEKATMQAGPGFYLTTDKKDAEHYAGNGFIKTVQLTRTSKLKTENSKIIFGLADKLISKMPDKENVLSNWDENPRLALQKLNRSMIEGSETLFELVQNIWADCYRKHELEYIENLKDLGIDGFVLPPAFSINLKQKEKSGIKHLVCYNPDILKIVDSEKF